MGTPRTSGDQVLDSPQVFFGRDVGGLVPTTNQVPVFDGQKWNPATLSAVATGAIGLPFVFAPGQVPGGNKYATEATLKAAITTALSTNEGPVTLAVDSSAAPATFVTAWPQALSLQINLVGARPLDPTIAPDVLTIADPGVFLPQSVGGMGFATSNALAPGLGALPNGGLLELYDGASLASTGAAAMGTIAAATTFSIRLVDGALFTRTGGAGAFAALAAATSVLNAYAFASQRSGGFVDGNYVSGAAGTLSYQHDDTRGPQVVPGGVTLIEMLQSVANEHSFLTSAQPPLPGAITTTEQAVGARWSNVRTAAAAFTFDAAIGASPAQQDQVVTTSAAGIVGTIPAGFAVGRELTLRDISRAAGATLFTFQPAAGEAIGNRAAGAPAAFTDVQARVVTIKKTGAAQWEIMSSSTLQ